MRNTVAQEILIALSHVANNRGDFFMSEVKSGESQTVNHFSKMDAVMIAKSWSHPCVEVFEIKSCRSDFMTDTKWPTYLNYCNRFNFVCPEGVIKKDELPSDVGLAYFKDGKIRTVRKPLYRNTDIPVNFFKYIIFNRLQNDRYPFHSDNRDFWNDWAKDRTQKLKAGRYNSTQIVRRLEELQEENERLKSSQRNNVIEDYNKIRKLLGNHGISEWNMYDALEKFLKESDRVSNKRKLIEIETLIFDLKKTI